jgi:uncharacterized protein (DUF433 family)
LARSFHTDNPFALLRFQSDGKDLFFDLFQTGEHPEMGNLVATNFGGQLTWASILSERLQEFEYDNESQLAVRWRLAGAGNPILIDPRIAFGAPNLRGVPTWVLKERWLGGEQIEETAEDFGLEVDGVRHALEFERVDPSHFQAGPCLH